MKYDYVSDLGVSEVVEEAIDQNALPDLKRRFHRFRRDLVGLDDESLDAQRQPQGERDYYNKLNQPTTGRFWLGTLGAQALLSPVSALSPAASASSLASAVASSAAGAAS